MVLCLGVENDLVLLYGSTLTWILCDDVGPQIDTYGLTDVFVVF